MDRTNILRIIHPEYLPLIRTYAKEIPDCFLPFFDSPALLRLKGISQNCGTEYCRYYEYRQAFSRLDHSLGVGLIVWNFTHDPKQALAGLFHDISHTVFSHVGDFLLGDAENQESAENRLGDILRNDPVIPAELEKLGLTVADVEDYAAYPIADNPGPRLSADRLEYTLSTARSFQTWDMEKIDQCYADIRYVESAGEIGFGDERLALEFAELALRNDTACFSSYESVSAMAFLAKILGRMADVGGLRPEELYELLDSDVIERIEQSADSELRSMWDFYRSLEAYRISRYPYEGPNVAISSKCKRRYIDPVVELPDGSHYRVSSRFGEFAEKRDSHLGRTEEWIVLDYPDGSKIR